ncbi:MAG TPA: Lpg1974 family pore-forming outer membrane protein [Rhabdochlamydiaceae bacterium]|nr:Lpg1974 family pore-forming outer membrane protein [Rhabdochlamydiaceae bacterium]
MKKLFALSLLSAASLLADNGADPAFDNEASLLADNVKKPLQQQPPRPAYTPPNSCCKPCCVPRPKKCIDCECYTPSFYEPNGCDYGLFFTADFLYWYGRETNLSYAAKEIAASLNPGTPLTTVVLSYNNMKHLDTKWAPGFRVGVGRETECGGWDYYLNYTWYHNRSKNRTFVPNFGTAALPFTPLLGQETLLSPWINPSIFGGGRPYRFNLVSALWQLTLQDIDFELGWKFWLSQSFTMRPFAAFRAAWVRRDFMTTSIRNNTLSDGLIATFKDRFKDRYWGVGMELGLQPEWYFTPNFAIISNFDASLIWGKFRDKKKSDYFSQFLAPAVDYHRGFKNSFSKMQTIIDLMVGFRWDATWACDRFRSALDIGWEHHVWFNFSNMVKTNTQFIASPGVGGVGSTENMTLSYEESQGDLIFGGLTIRFRFDF